MAKTTGQMLFEWRRAVIADDSPLTPTDRFVALAWSLAAVGTEGHPGCSLLSRMTGRSVSTVKRSLAALEALGFLALVERGGRKGESRRANSYTAVIPNQSTGATGVTTDPVQTVDLTGITVNPRNGTTTTLENRAREQIHERNARRARGEACLRCADSGWLEDEGGTVSPCLHLVGAS